MTEELTELLITCCMMKTKVIQRYLNTFRQRSSDLKMASSEDVRDIMGLPAQDTTITKDFILGQGQKKYASSVYFVSGFGVLSMLNVSEPSRRPEALSPDQRECTASSTIFSTVKTRNCHAPSYPQVLTYTIRINCTLKFQSQFVRVKKN